MNKTQANRRILPIVIRRLLAYFGPQHWWPGDGPFEIAVGAILTQGTNWKNASKAIENLKKAGRMSPSGLAQLSPSQLASLIRPSGYFRQKAKRLKGFLRYLQNRYHGRISSLRRVPAVRLRKELLALHGIGPETADSILLYALGKPAFVVDAYTRRVLARHSLIPWNASYEEIQALFTQSLPPQAPLFNETHALLVALGKNLCLTHPKCHLCPLRDLGKLRLETSPGKP